MKKRLATWLLSVPLVLGCRTSVPVLQTRDVAEISPTTGAVSATLVYDPHAPPVELGPGEEFVPAQLDAGNPHPEYPASVVPHRLSLQKVVMRVTFDEKGRPLAIAPSPLEASTPGQFLPQFEEAVRHALQMWRCSAPRIRKFRPGPDSDGDGKPDFRVMSDQKILKSFFDVAFTFEVIDGQPVVRRRSDATASGPPPP